MINELNKKTRINKYEFIKHNSTGNIKGDKSKIISVVEEKINKKIEKIQITPTKYKNKNNNLILTPISNFLNSGESSSKLQNDKDNVKTNRMTKSIVKNVFKLINNLQESTIQKRNKSIYNPIDLDNKTKKTPHTILSSTYNKNKDENSKSTNTSVTKNDKLIRTQLVKNLKNTKNNLNRSVEIVKSNKTSHKENKIK